MRFNDFDDLLKNKAETLPDHTALRFGEKRWTYRELYEAVCAEAEAYKATGKTCLGILADGSADCVIALFGAAKAGAPAEKQPPALVIFPAAYKTVQEKCFSLPLEPRAVPKPWN